MITQGVLNVLKNGNWQEEFDLTPAALPRSFLALLLYIPLYFICAKAAVKYNDVVGNVPFTSIIIILILMSLTFPLIAYLLCAVFDKQSNFRPWVIVRNWTLVFIIAGMSTGFGLYLIGILPFSVAYMIGLAFYLGTLAVIFVSPCARRILTGWGPSSHQSSSM
jgi:ABC-type multidrug transport system permease subunit